MNTPSLPMHGRRRMALTAFNPALPVDDSLVVAGELRDQFNSLKDLIDAIQTINAAVVDGTNTLPPENPASVSLSVTDGTLHFTFDIPQGTSGSDGGEGPPGPEGPQGVQGVPGEVTLQQLDDAITGTSANSNAVATLDLIPSDPPTQAEMQAVIDKINELIGALRR